MGNHNSYSDDFEFRIFLFARFLPDVLLYFRTSCSSCPSSANLLFGFQLPCRRLVGENQSIVALNPPSWNRRIAVVQPCER
jgi:hypothetical protein